MSAPTVKELQDRLELGTRMVAVDEVRPVMAHIVRGIVAAVTGSTASVRKGDAETEPTASYTIPADKDVIAGDLVLCIEEGQERVILEVLSRNALALPTGVAKIISSGTVTTAALTAPGDAVTTVNIETGLDYVPLILVYHFGSDLNWRPVPNVEINTETGQILDTFRCSFRVINTNQTRLAVRTQTTRPAGVAAQTYRWVIYDRSIG